MLETTKNGCYAILCDKCLHYEAFETVKFTKFIRQAKRNGWKILKKDGDWVHLCRKCAGEQLNTGGSHD